MKNFTLFLSSIYCTSHVDLALENFPPPGRTWSGKFAFWSMTSAFLKLVYEDIALEVDIYVTVVHWNHTVIPLLQFLSLHVCGIVCASSVWLGMSYWSTTC